MTTEKKIEVMKAYTEGMPIQICDNNRNEWRDVEKPTWDWVHNNYRIKSEEQTYSNLNTIDKVVVYDFERTADIFFKEFLQENNNNIYKANMANRVAYTKDGVAHWFMGDSTYRKWCIGRIYLLDEQLYCSGYLLRKSEESITHD